MKRMICVILRARHAVTLAALIGLLCVSCSYPPSEGSVKQLIRLQRSNCVFDVLEVDEVGQYNNKKNYWPVKVTLKGACDEGTRTVREDKSVVYKFFEQGKGFWRFKE